MNIKINKSLTFMFMLSLCFSAIQTGSPQLRKKVKLLQTSKLSEPVLTSDTTLQSCFPSYGVNNHTQAVFLPFDKQHLDGLGHSKSGSSYCYTPSDSFPSWRNRSGSTGSSDHDSLYNTSNDNFDSNSDKSSDSITNVQAKSKTFFPGFQFPSSSNVTSPNILERLCSNSPEVSIACDKVVSKERSTSQNHINHLDRNTLEGNKSLDVVSFIANENFDTKSSGVNTGRQVIAPVSQLTEKKVEHYPNVFPQWRNNDALCWLDVVLCLSVHNLCLRKFVFNVENEEHCVISKLIKAHFQAQTILKKRLADTGSESSLSESSSCRSTISRNNKQKKEGKNCNTIRSGCLEQCSTGDDTSSKTSDSSRVTVDSKGSLHHASKMEQRQLLSDVREQIWTSLQSKLRCKKGQPESPVFAFPLLLKHNEIATNLFKLKYR